MPSLHRSKPSIASRKVAVRMVTLRKAAMRLVAAVALGITLALAPACGSGTPSASIRIPPASFEVAAGGLPSTSTVFSVHVADEDRAFFLISDFTVGVLNGIIVASPIDGTANALTALPSVTYPASSALTRSDGVSVNGVTTDAQSPNAALLHGGKLFVSTSNFDLPSPFPNPMHPGTIIVYDVNGSALSNPRAIILDDTGSGGTGLYNPGAIIPFDGPNGTRLAVVVGDSAFAGNPTAAIVTIDPALETVDEILTIPGASFNVGSAALASDLTLYVGSSRAAELFVFDLAGAAPTSTAASPVAITTTVTSTTQDVSGVILSGDEAEIYVGNRNDASVTVLDRSTLTETQQFTAFRRSVIDRNANGFDNQIQTMLLRPGTTSDLRIGIIGIRASIDQVISGTTTAIDSLSAGLSAQVLLNAVAPPPFTANGFPGEIQQLFTHPDLAANGFYFAVEVGGTVRTLSFD